MSYRPCTLHKIDGHIECEAKYRQRNPRPHNCESANCSLPGSHGGMYEGSKSVVQAEEPHAEDECAYIMSSGKRCAWRFKYHGKMQGHDFVPPGQRPQNGGE